MKYVKPLTLYQQLMRKNGLKNMLLFPWNRHRLLCLEMRDKYFNLAVSNAENTIAAPLCTVGRQENDIDLLIDKLETSSFYYDAMGIIVRLPYQINPANPKGAVEKNLVKIFVDGLCQTTKLKDFKYTYWDDLITLKNMDFVIKHNVGIISEHLDLPEELSNDIMDKFSAGRVLQNCTVVAD
ncbi:hypothetical protein Dsin_014104 [Dipteronia sinensis]|uniref:Uncharacterized protein n=1 Tax=Dipteronia sinensis TaxID=43782 RepID=A0AAE0E9Q9_9ROSI|nr:hypothetical protein Dsin_014104 [Dipteronia sinensis]